MKRYLLDANFLLRFLLRDSPSQYNKAVEYLDLAKAGKIELIFPLLSAAEMVFVLERLYKFDRKVIVEKLGAIINAAYIKTDERLFLQQALLTYLRTPLHFTDCYLNERARVENSEVLTFDKDLKRQARMVL